MTRKEIATIINSVGIPTAYYQFDEETVKRENIKPPFICFYYDRSSDLYADNSNYEKIRVLIIELYSDAKDFILETTIENTLNQNEITYTKNEAFIDDEKMFITTYESEVLLNG